PPSVLLLALAIRTSPLPTFMPALKLTSPALVKRTDDAPCLTNAPAANPAAPPKRYTCVSLLTVMEPGVNCPGTVTKFVSAESSNLTLSPEKKLSSEMPLSQLLTVPFQVVGLPGCPPRHVNVVGTPLTC